ncbi:MAG: UDP-N-acetylmuramoyl-tripeptide--D-alanyl-D-alanine ligase [Firmicutes bacterium]|nr:UDP-N-acetylmuramoyl-tripeptide--D-alanyl-D-alanine ligase [Bacillota bacterium]
MIKRTLKEIQSMVNGYGLNNKNKIKSIKGVSTDTRTIKKDQLFIPIKGEQFNGHNFIKSAESKGACAALWCESEPTPDTDIPLIFVKDTVTAIQTLAKKYREELSMKVIGITGTNGKTSTKDILASILETKYKTYKTQGNLNNHLGVPLTLLSIDEDTEMAVIEMGMSCLGEIELLSKIAKPDAAIITNVGNAHLLDLKTIDNIIKAKLEIVKGLKQNGLFVCNGDNPSLIKEVNNLKLNQNFITFGKRESNDYSVKVKSFDKKGISFTFNKEKSPVFFLPLLGKHQIFNATSAIIIAKYFNIDFDLVKKGLLNLNLTKMRSELIKGEDFDILNDSYNSNPESTKAALDTIYSLNSYSQKIVVFGDMLELGEKEIDMHKEIGNKIDLNKLDYFFTIGHLAKHAGIEAKIKEGKCKVLSFMNKKELIKTIKRVVKKDSIILLKASRGMKLEEVSAALLDNK